MSTSLVDLRSDTVTRPTPAMLEAMMKAPVGDDVFDDDPTVHALQNKVAAMLGKESALFVATGVMANQLAVRSLLQLRPEILIPEVIIDVNAHVFRYESGGLAYHSRALPYPLSGKDGYLTEELVRSNIHVTKDVHLATTAIVALEVPMSGTVMPFDEIKKISAAAKVKNVFMHLDGARLFNASVLTGIPVLEYAAQFDSVSICLSKGLGAPIGSVLAGSSKMIEYARQFRKQMGGGWRQAGLLAAAGIYALDHHVSLLAEDHKNCARLAEGLQRLGWKLTFKPTMNMFFADCTDLGITIDALKEYLKKKEILIYGSGTKCRFVTHHQVSTAAVDRVIEEIGNYLRENPKKQ